MLHECGRLGLRGASGVIRVGVAGAAGRMGATTCEAVEAADDLELAARIDPELGVELADALDKVDVVVDFTTPDAAPENIRAAIESGTHIVVGTSSIPHERCARPRARGRRRNVLIVPNFAIGAVFAMRFAAEASKHMPEVEIIELHHDKKLDAPSGTAARTRDMIAEAGGNVHEPITRFACRALSLTRRSCSAARARRSRSATTRSTAPRSCRACSSRCAASARSGPLHDWLEAVLD